MEQYARALEERLKKLGDVEGLRLFVLYEAAVRAAEPVPIKVQATTDGNPRAVFVRPPRRQAFSEQLDLHRVSEGNARWAAKTTVASFVAGQRWEMADDKTLLECLAKQYKIKPEHTQLYIELVQKMIHAERYPRQYQQRAEKVAAAVEKERGVRV
jgi:predicted transcriptional regulator of viral defense system